MEILASYKAQMAHYSNRWEGRKLDADGRGLVNEIVGVCGLLLLISLFQRSRKSSSSEIEYGTMCVIRF